MYFMFILLHMKQKKKQKRFDVGTKVRHISREVFHGKLPSEKTMRDRNKFHKGSRGKQGRDSVKSDISPFIMFQVKQLYIFIVGCVSGKILYHFPVSWFYLFQVKQIPYKLIAKN